MTNTAPITPREARREHTTTRILDTAMHIIVTDGLDAFTIARLAKDMGYAVGALYRYFKGKQAIMAALQLRVVGELQRELTAIVNLGASKGYDEKELALLRVMASMTLYDAMTERRPTHHHILALAIGHPRQLITDDQITEGVMPALQSLLVQVAGYFEFCVQTGALEPGESARRTFVVWGGTQGVMMLPKVGRHAIPLEDPEVAREMLRTLLIGWGGSRAMVLRVQGYALALLEETDQTITTAVGEEE